MTTPPVPVAHGRHSARALVLKGSLLVVWALVSFVCCFFARDLQFMVMGWPFDYWMAAQGALLVFIGILAFYAWAMNRMDDMEDAAQASAGAPTDA